jgi:hypothetical protein
MSIKCKFGFHIWDGCKCIQCDKINDNFHDWSKDCGKCSKCGKTREEYYHKWSIDSEKCTICGKISETKIVPKDKRDDTDDIFSYITNSETLDLIKSILKEDSDDSKVHKLAKELIKLGNDAVKPFIDILCYGTVPAKRVAAISLGNLDDKSAVTILISNLSHYEWTIRYQSALALGKIGDSSCVESLKWQLANEDEGFNAPIYRIGDRVVDNMHDHVKEKINMAIDAISKGEKIPKDIN